MNKPLKNIIFCLAFVAIALLLPMNAAAELGGHIVGVNCNSGADPALDYTKNIPEQKSCLGQGITMNDLKVKIHFDGTSDNGSFIAAYNSMCVGISYLIGLGGWGSLAIGLYCTPYASRSGDIEIGVGETKSPSLGAPFPLSGPMVSFRLDIEGDKACAYGFTPPPFFLANFKVERTGEFNQKYAINNNLTSMPSNCVYMPEPLPAVKPPVPAFISQACYDYNTSASQFRWPANKIIGAAADAPAPVGNSRAFVGIVVQCIEDSMNNLFFNKHGNDTQTVFEKTQSQLRNLVQAMLVLYIISLGYKFARGDSGGIKQEEIIKIGLTIGFVYFFAVFDGTVRWLPGIVTSVKDISAIIIEASAGNPVSKTETAAALKTAEETLNINKSNYAAARISWATYTSIVPGYTASEKERRTNIMNNAKERKDQAEHDVEMAKMAAVSYGYDYCNFNEFYRQGKYNVPLKNENGVVQKDANGQDITKDMSYMRLWDSIDCRLAKYLGVGVNPDAPSTPNILLLSIGAMLGGPIGIVVFALLSVFLIFVVLIIIRMVHIYIIAYVAVLLLIYISPLIVPMMLFPYTKKWFDGWLKQLIAFCIQPIILFAFLAFMFSILDNIIYGSNYDFNPADKTQLVPTAANPASLNDNTIKRIKIGDKFVCPDANTLGCMYENFRAEKIPVEIFGAEIFRLYRIRDYYDPNSEYIYKNSMDRRVAILFDTILAMDIDYNAFPPVSIGQERQLNTLNAINEKLNTDFTLNQISGRTTTLKDAILAIYPEGAGDNVGQLLSECCTSIKNLKDQSVLELYNDLYYSEAHLASSGENSGALSSYQYNTLLQQLLKVTLACFILHALLGQVQEMSEKLTNISLGAAKMSSIPTANPLSIAEGTSLKLLSKLGSAAAYPVKAGIKAGLKKAQRSGIKADSK